MYVSHETLIVFFGAIFGIAIPILWIRPLWQAYSNLLLRISLFSLIVGSTIGVIGPYYLKLSPQLTALSLSIGGSIFFLFGVANLITYWWGDAGYALSLGIFGFFLHWIAVRFFPGHDPRILKIFILFCFLLSAYFLIFSLDVNPQGGNSSNKRGKIVTAVLGAIVTIVKFTMILMEFLRR